MNHDSRRSQGKRTALVLASLRGGGAERVMLEIANGLSKKGELIDLVLFSAEGDFLNLINPRINVIDLRVTRVSLGIFALAQYVRKAQPKTIISVLPHVSIVTLFVAKLFSRDSYRIVSEHNTLSKSVENSTTMLGSNLHLFMRWTYPWADQIVCVSSGVALDLARTLRLSQESIMVINNPVVSDTLFRQAAKRPDHDWYRNRSAPVILAAGRLVPAKDFSTLIRAFARVRKTLDARLIILGEGVERKPLTNLIDTLDLHPYVSLEGFVSNPFAFMASSDLFVLSSRWEGLPTVLIEALACGTPVVSTDCPSGPAEILENGKWGWLTPVGDFEQLAKAILSCIQNPPSTPKPEAWERYLSEHSINRYYQLISTEEANS